MKEKEREAEYIATVSGIFTNFSRRKRFQEAAAASAHPVVMYRWLSESAWLHTPVLFLLRPPLSPSLGLSVTSFFLIFYSLYPALSDFFILLLSLLLRGLGNDIFSLCMFSTRVTEP